MCVVHTINDDLLCHLAIIAYRENVTLTKGYVDVLTK